MYTQYKVLTTHTLDCSIVQVQRASGVKASRLTCGATRENDHVIAIDESVLRRSTHARTQQWVNEALTLTVLPQRRTWHAHRLHPRCEATPS